MKKYLRKFKIWTFERRQESDFFPNILKENADTFADFLRSIFNESVKDFCEFPSVLRQTNVAPAYKMEGKKL